MGNEGLLWILIACASILMIMTGTVMVKEYNVNVDFDEDALVDKIIANMPQSLTVEDVKNIVKNLSVENGSQSVEVSLSDVDYVLSKDEFEESAIEVKALEMADLELGSRDWNRAVYDALVDYNVTIDSYKHITKWKVMDSEVDGNEVTYDLKVYYYLDDDEDETARARLNEYTVTIDDLDYEDNFEDAEIDSDYLDTLTVLKVYD